MSDWMKVSEVWEMLNELDERFSSPVHLGTVPDLCCDTMAAVDVINVEKLQTRIDELESSIKWFLRWNLPNRCSLLLRKTGECDDWEARCRAFYSPWSMVKRIEELERENEELQIGKIARLARKVDELTARLEGREHIDSEDCWCHPTIESYDNGDLVIHHKPN